MHITASVQLEWDARKAAGNRRKHGVDFADAVAVLEDPLAVTIRDDAAGQERFVTVGTDMLGRLLVVVHTSDGDRIRMISARKATRRERRQYEG